MGDRIDFTAGIREIIGLMLNGVHTAFPALVVAFDPLTLRATVQPCLMRKYAGFPAATPLPVITDVPVMYPSSGNLSIVFPLDPGSYVLCVCSERSLELWLTSGGVVDPLDPRKFEITDAIAIPGLFPTPSVFPVPPVPGNLEIRDKSGLIMFAVTPTGIEFTGPVLFKGTVHACVVPNVPALVVDLATHNHPTAPVGPVSPPTPIPGP